MQLRRLSFMSENIWYDLVCITLYSIIFLRNWLLVANFLQIKYPVTSNWLLVANFSWLQVAGYQQLTFLETSSQLLVTGYLQLTLPILSSHGCMSLSLRLILAYRFIWGVIHLLTCITLRASLIKKAGQTDTTIISERACSITIRKPQTNWYYQHL